MATICIICASQKDQDRKAHQDDVARHKAGLASFAFFMILVGLVAIYYYDIQIPSLGSPKTFVKKHLGLGEEGAPSGGVNTLLDNEEPAAPPPPPPADIVSFEPSNTKTLTVSLSSDVLFEFGKADLKQAAGNALAQVAATIRSRPNATVTIRGYTDSVGTDQANLALSKQRAESVRAWFMKAGIPAAKLAVIGMGAKDPVAPNKNPDGSDNPAGRGKNRRVTISIGA